MAGPFQLGQRIGHGPTRNMKSAGQLGGGAFLVQTGQMVQHRKMRQLHTFGQRLGYAVTRQLVGHEQLAKQAYGKIVGAVVHGPANSRSCDRLGTRARAASTSVRSRSTSVIPGSVPPSASTSPQGAIASEWPWVRRPLPPVSA